MENIDGILGMSRKMDVPGVYTSGPLFIEALYNASLIKNKIFCFSMSLVETASYVDIGFIDQASFKGGSATEAGLTWF
jgi:hypothetical protein